MLSPARRYIAKGMIFYHKTIKAALQNMRVDLSGRNISMAKKELDTSEIRAISKEVACEGMSQYMGRNFARLYIGRDGQLLKNLGDASPGQMSASTSRGE